MSLWLHHCVSVESVSAALKEDGGVSPALERLLLSGDLYCRVFSSHALSGVTAPPRDLGSLLQLLSRYDLIPLHTETQKPVDETQLSQKPINMVREPYSQTHWANACICDLIGWQMSLSSLIGYRWPIWPWLIRWCHWAPWKPWVGSRWRRRRIGSGPAGAGRTHCSSGSTRFMPDPQSRTGSRSQQNRQATFTWHSQMSSHLCFYSVCLKYGLFQSIFTVIVRINDVNFIKYETNSNYAVKQLWKVNSSIQLVSESVQFNIQ